MPADKGPFEGGRLLIAASDAIVGLHREFLGKGPERCKTYWAGPDMLVIVLEGGFTVAERTLYESGHGGTVQSSRHNLQQALELRSSKIVEELTGRSVLAFLSASHQDPDVSVELFLLESEGDEGPAALASDPKTSG